MTRYDVKRELKKCYAPTNTDWALADVPAQQFIAVDGRGDPNTSADIYLSDPRRTEPAKLKTVLRQPVRKAG